MSGHLTELLLDVAALLAAAGVLCGVVVFATTRDVRAALPLMLDLFLAAGLLRLTILDTWTAIGSAAAIVAVRRLIGLGLAAGKGSRVHPASGTR